MYKVIALLARRADLSHAAFIEYYESRHAPLILALMPGIRGYRRNFLAPSGMIVQAGGAVPDFDVVTELWFADRAAFESAMRAFDDPGVMERLAQDEANLFDRSRTRFIAVEERISHIADGTA
jgi:uncharacterized protein (TIGR02118 family)